MESILSVNNGPWLQIWIWYLKSNTRYEYEEIKQDVYLMYVRIILNINYSQFKQNIFMGQWRVDDIVMCFSQTITWVNIDFQCKMQRENNNIPLIYVQIYMILKPFHNDASI